MEAAPFGRIDKPPPARKGACQENLLFRFSNSDVLHLVISGLSRKYIFITQEEKIQDIS
jgi:hypothetical protein